VTMGGSVGAVRGDFATPRGLGSKVVTVGNLLKCADRPRSMTLEVDTLRWIASLHDCRPPGPLALHCNACNAMQRNATMQRKGSCDEPGPPASSPKSLWLQDVEGVRVDVRQAAADGGVQGVTAAGQVDRQVAERGHAARHGHGQGAAERAARRVDPQ